jgi:hypothetical protein
MPALQGQTSISGLTAPGPVAQDTEKAAVFHYSKVKDERLVPAQELARIGVTFPQMLHYYIPGPYFTGIVMGDGRADDTRPANTGRIRCK